MVQFEYDGTMKRYNVKVPFTLAGESSMTTIASISEDEDARITLHRQVSLRLLKQVILNWDEYEYQLSREIGDMLDEPKHERLVYLEERLQIPGRKDRTDAWKDISIDAMELSTRSHFCIITGGIRTFGDLVEKKASDLIKMKNFGRKSLTEVEEKLNKVGLALKQPDEIERRQYGI